MGTQLGEVEKEKNLLQEEQRDQWNQMIEEIDEMEP